MMNHELYNMTLAMEDQQAYEAGYRGLCTGMLSTRYLQIVMPQAMSKCQFVFWTEFIFCNAEPCSEHRKSAMSQQDRLQSEFLILYYLIIAIQYDSVGLI